MTAGEAMARLDAAEALAAEWLQDKRPVDAGYSVKTVEVYRSAGGS